MLNSKATQFSLSSTGEILWQEKINNPVPGVAVARLEKGDHPMRPKISVIEGAATSSCDRGALENALKIWLNGHMQSTLEPLVLLGMGLQQGTDAENPVHQIASSVYDRLGILPREELESAIENLSTEQRAELRAKKIRLGPILVFIPALNKPAAVRLRALLWSLYHDAPLPAPVPADGIVSVKIEGESANPAFYRAIGYPLYGGRAVRIDMLDRVISCVYDHAEHGKFQARHEMAEWLGSSIEDLYKILSDMGHTKIYDPAEQEQEQEQEQGSEEGDAAKETAKEAAKDVPSEESVQDQAKDPAGEEAAAQPDGDGAQEVKPLEKPELATFRLKRGKAFQKQGDRKPFKPKGQKSFKKKDDKAKSKGKYGKDKKPRDESPRVISIEAKRKEEDNPFAVLQQLKAKSDG